MITVIIPVFNEKNTIASCLQKVFQSPLKKQVIVVDDASTDGTSVMLSDLKKSYPFELISHEKNMGKGAAIKTAINLIAGEAVIIQDADLEYDPNEYEDVLGPIIRGEEMIVYGSRNLRKNGRSSLSFYLGGKLITAVANFLYRTKLTDINTCYKGFSSSVIKFLNISNSRFDFCEEVTAKAIKAGYRIKEVPISYYPRSMQDGKKIRPSDGLRAIATLLRNRF